MAFDVLDAQQAEVHDAFREGFESPQSLLEWMHAAGAVSLGYVDNGWFPRVMGDWWTVAGFVTDPELRDDLATHPPANPSSIREQHIQQELLPAFNSAIGLFRMKANEYEEHQAPESSDDQRWLAMRPRLHQVAVAQHRVLRSALGADDADDLEDRQDVTDWARTVIQTTTGTVSSEWLKRVTKPTGAWFDLLTGDVGQAVLLSMVAEELMPSMNAALNEAAQRGNEEIESGRDVDQSPMEYS